MRSVAATKRLICSVAFLSAVGWANQAHAQLGVGTTWVRTDAQGKGITMTVEACCNGGLRLIYQIPAMANQPATTHDGQLADGWHRGAGSGWWQAVRRDDGDQARGRSSLQRGCENEWQAVWNVQRHGVGGRQDDDGREHHPGGRQRRKDHRDVGAEIGAGPAEPPMDHQAPPAVCCGRASVPQNPRCRRTVSECPWRPMGDSRRPARRVVHGVV